MQFGFAGSPTFAADILQYILDVGHQPRLIITQAAKPTGRGKKLLHTPVHALAERVDVPVVSPKNINECAHLLKELKLLVVVAYGQILSQSILETPLFGCINVHASILPRWRGASPIEHSILSGDSTTGISVMQIVSELDAGPVYLMKRMNLEGNETTASLSTSLAKLGGAALVEVLNKLVANDISTPTPQPRTGVTYAPRLTTNDARIDWGQSASTNERKIRAFVDRSAAFTTRGDLRLRILKAKVLKGEFVPGRLYRTTKNAVIGCQQDGLSLLTVQLNRGKGTRLDIAAALNGFSRLLIDGIQFD